MKTMIVLLISAIAFAYNPNPQKITLGKSTVVGVNRNSLQPHIVSLELDVRSKVSQLPRVVSVTGQSGLCKHKQTLISYAGYDRAAKKYIRTYEIQIEVNPNRRGAACTFVITSEKGMRAQDGARVTVML